ARVVTTDVTYLRFHGVRYGGSYSRAQLRPWARGIAQQRARHTGVFAYFNNDADGHAVENARTLRSMGSPSRRMSACNVLTTPRALPRRSRPLQLPPSPAPS